MLNVGKLTGEASARYYLESVASGLGDYYLHAGEAPGVWLGSEAGGMGLRGEVTPEQLMALLRGDHPLTREHLAPPQRAADRMWGYDLTFRAPKSVSLLFALGRGEVPSEVVGAHEAAVRVALGYLEREACFGRRRIDGEIAPIAAGGFIGAAFRHRTSRAGDPLLHTHVLVANLVRGIDGRWGAIDGRLVYAHAKAAGALYQAELRSGLTSRLGVGWTAVRNGLAEVDGVPAEVVRAFSRRRQEITALLDARGESSPRAAQVATLASRRAKDPSVAVEGLLPEWRVRAAGLGFDDAALAATLGRTEGPGGDAGSLARRVEALLGPEGLTAHASSFTRRDALLALCDQLSPATSARRIEEVADRLLESTEVVRLREVGVTAPAMVSALRRDDGRLLPGPDDRRFTTRELLALEREVVEGAVARRGDRTAVAQPPAVEAALAARPSLSDEQLAMCRALLTSGDGVQVIRGHAGTGKTYALDACRAAWEASGMEVLGAALSARAAAELQAGSGITSSTLHRLLWELGPVPVEHRSGFAPDPIAALELGRRSVVVVDEAGMVGTRQLARLLGHARAAGAGVVLVGDDHQLPEIDAGGAFRGLADRLGALELTDNRRQSQAWEREALRLLRDGRAPEAIAAYQAHGRVVTGASADAVRARLVADWWTARGAGGAEGGGGVVMVAARRADVRELNARARQLRVAAGEVHGTELSTRGGAMAAGDLVMARRNSTHLRVHNGDRGTVLGVDEGTRAVTVELDRGARRVRLPADYLDAGHLTHAYAFTAHAAQGTTVDRALVLGDDSVYREWGYVAMSRGREENRLYVVDSGRTEEARLALHGTSLLTQPDMTEVVAWLERSRAQHLARDGGVAIPRATDVERHRLRRLSDDELIRELGDLERGRSPDWPRPVTPHPSTLHQAERVAEETGSTARHMRTLGEELRGRLANEGWAARRIHRRERTSDAAWLRQLDAEQPLLESMAAAAATRLAELREACERRHLWDDEWTFLRAGDIGRGDAVRGEIARREADRVGAVAARVTQQEACVPQYLRAVIGCPPDGVAARRAWRTAAALVDDHRTTHGITDAERPLGDTMDTAAGRAVLWRLGELCSAIPGARSRLAASLEAGLPPSPGRRGNAESNGRWDAAARVVDHAPHDYRSYESAYVELAAHLAAPDREPHISL